MFQSALDIAHLADIQRQILIEIDAAVNTRPSTNQFCGRPPPGETKYGRNFSFSI